MSNSIELRDPNKLRLHPFAKAIDDGDEDSPRQLALADSVGAHGVREPLLISSRNEILHGKRRWRAAKRYQLPTLPCLIVPAEQDALAFTDALLLDRGYTPAQRCYLAVISGAVDRAFEELKAGENDQKPQCFPSEVTSEGKQRNPSWFSRAAGIFTADEWAKQKLGVTARTLQHCRELARIWAGTYASPDGKITAKDAAAPRTITDRDGITETEVTLREFFEPRILRDEEPYWVGYVLTAIKQIMAQEKHGGHRGGKPVAASRQLDLFNKVIHDEVNRWEYWQKFNADERTAHFAHVREKAEELSPEACAELAAYHAKLAAEFKQAAKRAPLLNA